MAGIGKMNRSALVKFVEDMEVSLVSMMGTWD